MSGESSTDDSTDAGGWFARHAVHLRRAGASLALGAAVATLAYWFALPPLAESMVRSRLGAVESRTGTTIDFDRLAVSAVDGARLEGLRVDGPDSDRPLARLESARVDLAMSALLWGRAVVTRLELRGARLFVRRRSEGRSNLRVLYGNWLDGSGGEAGEPEGSPSSQGGLVETLFEPFGGEWPELALEDVALVFEQGSWPLERVAVSSLTAESTGASADLRAEVTTVSGEGRPRWSIPKAVQIRGTLARPLEESTGRVDFSSPLELVGLPPYPFVRVGASALELTSARSGRIEGLSVAIQGRGSPERFFEADAIEASLGLPAGPLKLPRIRTVGLDSPRLTSHFDRRNAGALTDVLHLVDAPVADRVHSRARRVAAALSDGDVDRTDPSARQEESTPAPSTHLGTLAGAVDSRLFPQSIAVEDATVHFTDERRMDLVDPDPEVALRDGRLTVERIDGSSGLELRGAFAATDGRGASRGDASFECNLDFSQRVFQGSIDVRELDLAWLAQIGGPPVARSLKGGRVSVSSAVEWRSDADRHDVEGQIDLTDATLDLPALADEPLTEVDAGYQMEGYVDSDGAMPAPDLLEWGEFAPDESTSAPPPDNRSDGPNENDSDAGVSRDAGQSVIESAGLPVRGAVVVETGRASLNGIEADVRPQIYGLDGLGALPTRVDLTVSLDRLPVQRLFDGIPAAVKGPLNGSEMEGSFAWSLDLELPVHNADQIDWRAAPSLRRFDLVSLPASVDVRRLEGRFEHDIRDEAFEFERTVHIPPMRPTPASWLTDHSELDLGEIDRRRRSRNWPTPPDSAASNEGADAPSTHSPAIWSAPAMEQRAADLPWAEESPLASVDKLDFPAEARTPRDRVAHIRSRLEDQRRRLGDTFCPPSRSPCLPGSGEDAAETASAPGSGGSSGGDPLDLSFEEGGNRPSSTDQTADSRPEPDAPSPPVSKSMIVRFDGRERVYPYGPYVYVPLHHISKWVPLGVMTTEDNSLFEHHGFNWYALEESLEENIDEGGFVRGASTVSMQLVKNLFLTFDKVLARKAREAFLVWLMEDVVDIPKARILELYLNIIEFGPAVYGIHDASVHYFGKRPDELNLREATWLVSIIPNPKKHHRQYVEGQIRDSWYRSMKTYIEIMYRRGRISAQKYVDIFAEKPPPRNPDAIDGDAAAAGGGDSEAGRSTVDLADVEIPPRPAPKPSFFKPPSGAAKLRDFSDSEPTRRRSYPSRPRGERHLPAWWPDELR